MGVDINAINPVTTNKPFNQFGFGINVSLVILISLALCYLFITHHSSFFSIHFSKSTKHHNISILGVFIFLWCFSFRYDGKIVFLKEIVKLYKIQNDLYRVSHKNETGFCSIFRQPSIGYLNHFFLLKTEIHTQILNWI